MYAVFSVSNLCPGRRKCLLFEDESGAGQFLQDDWEDCLNTLIAKQNGMCCGDAGLEFDEIDYALTYREDDYAVISDIQGSRIEWYVAKAEEVKPKGVSG